jgi:pilus assembly protein CpaB
MSARQLIVLGVAFLAAIGALLVIRGMGSNSAPAETPGETIAGEQVLVAAHPIAQGAALTEADLTPRLFPQASVNPQFIRAAQQPEMVGAVTRRAFLQGEPIVQGSVIQPEGRGFMAAVLPPGYRAVAVEIEPMTAAGGFIQPNDRVDVIVTARLSNREVAGGERVRSNTLLEDVRVLALDDKLQTQEAGAEPERIEASIAVLELSARDAEALAMADELGTISLALRGVEAEPPGMRVPSASREAPAQRSESVRVHAFGTVSEGGSR